jgi:hypothetical protein
LRSIGLALRDLAGFDHVLATAATTPGVRACGAEERSTPADGALSARAMAGDFGISLGRENFQTLRQPFIFVQ